MNDAIKRTWICTVKLALGWTVFFKSGSGPTTKYWLRTKGDGALSATTFAEMAKAKKLGRVA